MPWAQPSLPMPHSQFQWIQRPKKPPKVNFHDLARAGWGGLLLEHSTTVPPFGWASLSHLMPCPETFFVVSWCMLGCMGEMAKRGLPWLVLVELICCQKLMKLMPWAQPSPPMPHSQFQWIQRPKEPPEVKFHDLARAGQGGTIYSWLFWRKPTMQSMWQMKALVATYFTLPLQGLHTLNQTKTELCGKVAKQILLLRLYHIIFHVMWHHLIFELL